MPVYDDIRQAITASGTSRYRIAKDTGFSEAHLSQFMAGTKGLSMEAMETLASYLDLEILARPIKRIKPKRKDG